VTRLGEFEAQVLSQMVNPAIGNPDHQILYFQRIGHPVERFAAGLSLAFPLQKLEILFLDMRRIGQHDGTKVPGCRCGVNGTVKTAIDEQGKATRVVDVRVAENDPVNPPRVEGQILVELGRFLPPALEETSVKQNPGPRCLQQMHAPGNLARRTVKGEPDTHRPVPKSRSPASPSPGRM
jgi:hypothetical protein